MLLRDARGVVHDLGPRRIFQPSLLKIAPGYGEEATGGWQGHAHLFTRAKSDPQATYAARKARERAARAGDVERHRELERTRRARWRARQRGMVGA